MAAKNDGMYGYRARIGYTSPPLTTEVFPYEFYKVMPDGVTLVITTLAIVERSKEEVERSYEISMNAARAMAKSGVDMIMLGGVPINVSRGYANAQAMISDLEKELGVTVSTSANAQTKAFKALGSKRIVVAHPYEESENWRFDEYSQKFGCEVLGTVAWGTPIAKVGTVPRHAALELGRKVLKAHPDADTILFPSPHWPVIEAVEALEREFGVTTMSSMQAIFWDMLRSAGIKDGVQGYGRLLRDF
jgi:maleate cis-trans isomerase